MGLSRLSRSVVGARVLVTGAASGMGRATARLFADEGARVFLADWDREGLEVVTTEIQAMYGADSAGCQSGDVGKGSDRETLIATAAHFLGGLDILINNAGISRVTSVHSDNKTFQENWDETLAVNVSAHAHLIRLALPQLLLAPHGGRVVNVASTEAVVATRGIAAYTASKHAVIGLTKSFAVELGRSNITINAICPGPILTGMTSGISDESKEKYARRKVPLGRYGDPEEVAQMTLSVCLPAASFLNGAAIVVDGGMSINHG
jgi:3-oxoacyl-[acyl-carrier protein] reductase